MIAAAGVALAIFVIVFSGLSVIEAGIHKLRHNPDTSYHWGVWLFSILAAAYAFVTSLGR